LEIELATNAGAYADYPECGAAAGDEPDADA
jgi:hypothetical protein